MGYDLGGVLTSGRRDGEHKKQKESHCLYPGDLYPFTRRPLFVIVDSDNSFVFQHIPRYFGQPLVTLMSPQDTPPAFQGNLCILISKSHLNKAKWEGTGYAMSGLLGRKADDACTASGRKSNYTECVDSYYGGAFVYLVDGLDVRI